MSKSPAFLLYVSDWLLGTRRMSYAEKGFYIELLCEQWDHGFIPALSNGTPKHYQSQEEKSLWLSLAIKFELADGKLHNHKLEKIRADRKDFVEIQRAKGKKGAEKRWKNKDNSQPIAPAINGYKKEYPNIAIEDEDVNEDESVNTNDNLLAREIKKPTVKKIKIEVASDVFLTADEIEKTKERYGVAYQWAIDKLSNWKVSKGKSYKSDYHALCGWVYENFIELNIKHNARTTTNNKSGSSTSLSEKIRSERNSNLANTG